MANKPSKQSRPTQERDDEGATGGRADSRLIYGFHAVLGKLRRDPEAVFEIYLTLQWLLGDRSPTLSQAVVFEALNRVVTVVFKFVPFRLGVDEALSGALAPVLAVNPAAGVALALIRKIRNLAWAAIGLAIVAAHPQQTTEHTIYS